MNTFRCTRCGFHVQRPTQPYSCPQCGTQAVGLFQLVPQGAAPPQPQGPPQYQQPQQPQTPQMPGYPAQPQYLQQPPAQQRFPTSQPQQPGFVQGYPQYQQPAAPQQPAEPQYPQAPAYPQAPGYGTPAGGYPAQPSAHGGIRPGGIPRAPGVPQPQPPAGAPPQYPSQPGYPAGPQQPQHPQQPQQPYYAAPQQGGQAYPTQGFPTQQPQAPAPGYPANAPATPQQPYAPYPQQGAPYQTPPPAQPPQGYPAQGQPPQGRQPASQQPQPGYPFQPVPQQPSAPQTPPAQPPASSRQAPQPPPPTVTGGLTFQSLGTPQAPPSRPTPAAQRPQTPKQRPTTSKPAKARPPAPQTPTRTTPPAKTPQPAAGKRSTVRPAAQPAKAEPPKPAAKPRKRPEVLRPKEFVWAFPAEPPFSDKARPARNAPAVDAEGRIYLCTQGRLYALVEEEGQAKVVWEYVIGTHVPGPVVIAPDGTIRVHAGDGLLHCINPSGKQHWTPADVGEPLGWAAPVVDSRGNTYICVYDGGLIRVDGEGKAGRHPFFRSRRKFDSSGVVLSDVLLVGSEDGYVFAISLDEDEARNVWDHSQEFGYAGGFINSAPAVSEAGGIIVVAARDENLYGFAPTGAKAWNVKLPGQLLGSPVIGPDGHILVGVTQAPRGQQPSGLLFCVDGNSHKVRWQYATGDAIESTPAIGDDGLIYFGDNSGTIHALDSSGEVQWKAKVESPVRSSATILAPQRLAVALDNDTVVVLKCSSNGLATTGWPKLGRNLGQTGLIEG